MTRRIHVDFETRSTCDLRTLGSTIYAQHWTTTPILLGFIDEWRETVFDFLEADPYRGSIYPFVNDPLSPAYMAHPPVCPKVIANAVADDAIFVAHNSRFEQDIWYWVCHQKWGWPMPRRWSCTAARARYWGIRASLEGAGDDLEIEQQKLSAEGKEFINTFCIPRKWHGPKKNGIVKQLWAEPHDLPEQWSKGKQYCLVDVKAEMQIDALLPDLPAFEQSVWDMDFSLNTHGLPIDTEAVNRAIHFSDHYSQTAAIRFNAITSVNPTQRDKVLEYINQREEMDKLPNLQSKTLGRIVQADLPPDLQDVINIRLDCSRASVKKLQSMLDNTSFDGFARGLFLYYGAHTGRWSGKRLQPHNFIRGKAKSADVMFRFLEGNSWHGGLNDNQVPVWVDSADMLFPRPLKTLSQSMRGFIKAPDGKYIVSGDYAQIEARVLAWLANCEPLLRAYAAGEDVYVRFAADNMYRRAYTDYFGPDGKVIEALSEERQRAKSAVLGCGFQLAAKGFQAYCDALDIVITLEEAEFIVRAYRDAYPEISNYQSGLWSRANYCALQAVINEGEVITLWGTEITFHVHRLDKQRWWLLITLPSGRHIAYYRPRADEVNRWGQPTLSYRSEWHGRTQREQTYGGKIVENIVQAVARDICAVGALNARAAGFELTALIHDEVVSIHPSNSIETQNRLKACLLDVPHCYAGLPLNAEVKAMRRYSK